MSEPIFSIERERADWITSPGKTTTLRVGPVVFVVQTSDKGLIGWEVNTRWGGFGWSLWRGRP